MEKLTPEQAKLASDNHNLIYKFMSQKNLYNQNTTEDYYGTLAYALCKAAATYDPDKGYAFSTYAYMCMNNEVKVLWRHAQNGDHIPNDSLFYYDDCFDAKDNSISYIETYSSNTNIEDEIVTKMVFLELLSSLSERDCGILLDRINGMNQQNLAKKYGISQTKVNRILKKMGDKIKGESTREKSQKTNP